MTPPERKTLRFKVTLEHVKPPIWRRLVVPASYSFWDLHVAIQDVMGWKDCHLHCFRVRNPSTRAVDLIGTPLEPGLGGPTIIPGWKAQISSYFNLAGQTAEYEYDFGDSWCHELALEAIETVSTESDVPACLGGERACPPEDCGGVPGYQELLEKVLDPEHSDDPDLMEWLGGSYDPEAFVPEQVQFDDPLERFRRAFSVQGLV